MNDYEKQITDWPELRLFEEKAAQERRERLTKSERLSKRAIIVSWIAMLLQIVLILTLISLILISKY